MQQAKGSVANVVLAALTEYKKQQTTEVELEKKVLAIQKTVEEATALEMPMMQENLPIIGTIVTLGTLMGLLGTVMGMIKSILCYGRLVKVVLTLSALFCRYL